MAAGAGLTTLGVAMRPVQMLKLSLTLLTPFVEMAKNNKGWKHQLSRDSSIFSSFKGLGQEKMVLHDTNDVPSWDLPPYVTAVPHPSTVPLPCPRLDAQRLAHACVPSLVSLVRLATLKESCHLLESNLKQPLRNNWIQPGGLSQSQQDFYLCLASSMQLEMIGRQCEIDREISDYYGEPVCLCTRAA
jgi:hypothetical protein